MAWISPVLTGLYGKPFIIDDSRTRQLLFSLDFIQDSMCIDDPCALDFAYTSMMAFPLFLPDPGHVLMVGLGAGQVLPPPMSVQYHRVSVHPGSAFGAGVRYASPISPRCVLS